MIWRMVRSVSIIPWLLSFPMFLMVCSGLRATIPSCSPTVIPCRENSQEGGRKGGKGVNS